MCHKILDKRTDVRTVKCFSLFKKLATCLRVKSGISLKAVAHTNSAAIGFDSDMWWQQQPRDEQGENKSTGWESGGGKTRILGRNIPGVWLVDRHWCWNSDHTHVCKPCYSPGRGRMRGRGGSKKGTEVDWEEEADACIHMISRLPVQ